MRPIGVKKHLVPFLPPHHVLLSLTFTWKVLAPYSGPLAVLGTVLYVLSFSLGAGPVPALLLLEIFASGIRAKAVAEFHPAPLLFNLEDKAFDSLIPARELTTRSIGWTRKLSRLTTLPGPKLAVSILFEGVPKPQYCFLRIPRPYYPNASFKNQWAIIGHDLLSIQKLEHPNVLNLTHRLEHTCIRQPVVASTIAPTVLKARINYGDYIHHDCGGSCGMQGYE
ncbi:hypothetical protein Nepgr_029864 [Nepenthes gracilis]|uniref:Uncharacterized protein n=1 Tax=Nepenthes gracilis TaxID=150966 RepID=A0AAD3Y5Z4_NEPGR|nr:hypothetical protein Nepgr_029864 [Nepenthes gracilis]